MTSREARWASSVLHQTPGIRALPPEEQSAIREKVKRFNTWTVDNDPYGEHDFGSFDHNGDASFGKSTTTTASLNSAAKTRAIRGRRGAC
jgi:hypothetical protein